MYKIKTDSQTFDRLGYFDVLDPCNWDQPLLFESIADADHFLRHQYEVTPNSDGSQYSSDAEPYHLAHNQYGIPDYKIVSAKTGKQNQRIRDAVKKLHNERKN